MSKKKCCVKSRKFKVAAVSRMLAGENVHALARELKVLRKDLYVWRDRFRSGGPEALRGPGRPRKVAAGPVATATSAAAEAPLEAARRRIAELERKVGQQQVDLDFFRQALQQVRGTRRPSDALGVKASTRSSKR
jgi:transposase-like protein